MQFIITFGYLIYQNKMPVITLTSDWGLKDHYLSVIKACIYSQLPDANIVDISHLVPPYNISQASYIFRNAYQYFPNGTIHIISVNSIASIDSPHVVIKHKGHYFIGADNGFFSLVFDKKPEVIIELEVMQDSDYFTFPTRDIFVKVACHIAIGNSLDTLGKPLNDLHIKNNLAPIVEENKIRGMVVYVDIYENAITNIHESTFKMLNKGRPFRIVFKHDVITKLSSSYSDVAEGDLLALFDSNGYLQIAMNQDKAKSLMGLNIDENVYIEFD